MICNASFDVVVLGCGPAGLAAAIRASAAGLATAVLIPETPTPRWARPAGTSESVHPGIQTLLRELGAEHAVYAASRGTYKGIWVRRVHAPLGEDDDGPWTGHHVDRERFEGALLERARVCGVTILAGAAEALVLDRARVIGVRTRGGDAIKATFIIDATGQRRVGAKCLAIDPTYLSGPLVVRTGCGHLPRSIESGSDPVFIPEPKGWTWIAPDNGGTCTWTQLAKQGCLSGEVPLGLDGPERGRNELRERRVSNVRWRVHARVVASGMVMVGDAAGLLDPGAGQGILLALWSGIMAVHAIRRALEVRALEASFFAQYDAWFQQHYALRAERLRKLYDELGIDV